MHKWDEKKWKDIVKDSLASLARTLSKIAQDICLYLSQSFNFISFPDFLTTGSSIMPHKKNPDVFEIIRAKCNSISSLPNEISLIVSNFCSGFHRDFQIIKERFLPVFDELKKCFSIFRYMLNHIVVRKDILFREAYQKMATDIFKMDI
ncbi:lyase family protein [Blattabacterium cuenoti]|uniref:lyase family protein n=1 Tax=Blattabacterium cuenoti TaxID=1653831 RepID=UPI00293BAC41|nr:lyase family protein [Blattabacterium cuenoti]